MQRNRRMLSLNLIPYINLDPLLYRNTNYNVDRNKTNIYKENWQIYAILLDIQIMHHLTLTHLCENTPPIYDIFAL